MLEDYSNNTELLKILYQDGYIGINGKPTDWYSNMN